MSKKTQGITVKKAENFSEWYTQAINKAELIEYTDIAGCLVFRPNAYALWENVQAYFDKEIKNRGVRNAYFPLFIPESLLTKESEHVEGFAPEVAWVTHAGDSKLKERLAVRPTSETIMYDTYKKWIRSHRDLPLKINQWNNVVRWEFKHAVPFLRTREFLWQEGHTCFATKEEAMKETHDILELYAQVFEELMAIPVLRGQKSEKEKFAGADVTLSVETIFPNGKAIQGATSHHLGQNFSVPFDISFINKNEQKDNVWQNSWGLSTRSLGIMLAVHGDDQGLVLPPRIASEQIVILPIFTMDEKENKKVLVEANKIKDSLIKKGIRAFVDDRDNVRPGWKFNEWELKGVPLRIEIGPRDLAKKVVLMTARDNGKKQEIKMTEAIKNAEEELEAMHKRLYNKAQKFLKSHIKEVSTITELKNQAKEGFGIAPWCGSKTCEENIKDKTSAKSLNSPFKQTKTLGKCFACKETAKAMTYFGRSY